MRVLGIDYGDARVGVAASDVLGMMAHGVETVPNRVYEKMLDRLTAVCAELKPDTVVVGLPRNMDGTEGFRALATHDFVADLAVRVPGVDIVLWDERLTTLEAAGILNQTNTRGKNRKAVIDTVAAEIILQSYLDAKRSNNN